MIFKLVRPAIFALKPENAHRFAIWSFRHLPKGRPVAPGPLAISIAGLDFPNPVGMAAGFDKDAEIADALLGLGFGFVEVGTITPKPQPGNPAPRLFRLGEDKAIINRMGFNNSGLDEAMTRMARLRSTGISGIVGVNVGANKDSADRIADYVEGVRRAGAVADYITVNISSPNTPGLRQLQDKGALDELLGAIAAIRNAGDPPIFLKVAPDLEDGEHEHIVRAATDHRFDALIVSNTTIARPALTSPHAVEAGGLSGAPLRAMALEQLRRFHAVSGGALPLIGVGGIATAEDAWERIRAGASLVQIYSAMIYYGPEIARNINRGLERLMDRDGFASIAEAVGSE
ncbi:MAG: quinone-dependent dihydroorotate dehydrogenase [Sphingomonadaceae bacterium]